MNSPKRLRQEQRLEETQEQRRELREKTFDSVEEMLRYDASQTPPPPSLAARLTASLAAQPKPRAWWKRFLPKW